MRNEVILPFVQHQQHAACKLVPVPVPPTLCFSRCPRCQLLHRKHGLLCRVQLVQSANKTY